MGLWCAAARRQEGVGPLVVLNKTFSLEPYPIQYAVEIDVEVNHFRSLSGPLGVDRNMHEGWGPSDVALSPPTCRSKKRIQNKTIDKGPPKAFDL